MNNGAWGLAFTIDALLNSEHAFSMPRKNRTDGPGQRHHVMNRGARRAPIFRRQEHCLAFIDLLSQLPERFGLAVHGYALMPNHYHLMLQSERGELSRGMAFVQSRYSLRVNRDRSWDGPLFRGRFHSRQVGSQEHWRHLLAYLHLNPVRARLVMTVAQAHWTSHEAYAGRITKPDWLTTKDLLAAFGGRKRYLAYLRSYRGKGTVPPEDFESDVLFGGGRLSEAAAELAQQKPAKAPAKPSLSNSLTLASRRLEVRRKDLVTARAGKAADPRRPVLVWWLVQHQGIAGKDVAEALGISRGRVSQLVSRVQEGRADVANKATIEALCGKGSKAKR